LRRKAPIDSRGKHRGGEVTVVHGGEKKPGCAGHSTNKRAVLEPLENRLRV